MPTAGPPAARCAVPHSGTGSAGPQVATRPTHRTVHRLATPGETGFRIGIDLTVAAHYAVPGHI